MDGVDVTVAGKQAAPDGQVGRLPDADGVVRPLFDAVRYAQNYPDVHGDAEALLRHFCQRGWKEGRNPNDQFDTVSYLHAHTDIAAAGLNPFYHYLIAGRVEHRRVQPAVWPSASATQVLGHDPGGWVELLRPLVDEEFYARRLGAAYDGSFDLAAHFAYRGWLEGYDPAPGFSVSEALERQPGLRTARLNPLLQAVVGPHADPDDHALQCTRFPRSALFGIGEQLAELRAQARPVTPTNRRPAADYADPVERIVAGHLDAEFYLTTYQDVAAAGTDPVHHYCACGWTEGRQPADWFDTDQYLRANPDVRSLGLNPFWHYLVAGRTEGRPPRQAGGYKRSIIEAACDPDEAAGRYDRTEPPDRLTRPQITALLKAACAGKAGLAVSLSHDCYLLATGGIQVFIADEQKAYAARGIAYLNLSPFRPLLRLADPDDADRHLVLVLDGTMAGVARADEIAAALGPVSSADRLRRLFIAHCLLGHNATDVIALQAALGATENLFWVHDYSSICTGYTLLRNDVEYCGAPPPDSMTCRVCVHGGHRRAHAAEMRRVFDAISFDVVAPSQAALQIWRSGSNLPHRSARWHEHCRLVEDQGSAAVRSGNAPVRVAYVGYQRAHKGWPIWDELVMRTHRLGIYEFIHIGSPETAGSVHGAVHYAAQTTAAAPDAMIRAIQDLRVDLVLVLSTWPETFSYVTFESLAAGADVVCLADSGNIAAAVLRQRRGIVAADQASLFALFESLRAAEYVRLCREQGTAPGELVRDGTSATLEGVA